MFLSSHICVHNCFESANFLFCCDGINKTLRTVCRLQPPACLSVRPSAHLSYTKLISSRYSSQLCSFMLNNPQINNSSRHRESNNNNKNLGKQYNRINTFIDMQTSALRRIKIRRLFYRNARQNSKGAVRPKNKPSIRMIPPPSTSNVRHQHQRHPLA